ncbi:COX15/CtaA family protein [Acidocella facilis]|uniref:COX15/CtaA family protein n=1 Tax=Acidocella facilis TaxID=525 RepID=UPI00047880CD|nr:COX15/CtaA family protein [Acidocella facilis]
MRQDRAVGTWLLLLAGMVFGMVVGGGHARTIGAGFTIQVWRPFTGFIPPLNAADWNQLYGLYQYTAQYQAQPIDMAQYKALFWPMFLDRCWGRLMACVFLLPFGYFLLKGRIQRKLALWLGFIFLLGAGQATYGWYMVQTGMYPGVVSPPPEWAAPHLLSAMLILLLLIWTGMSLRAPEPVRLDGAGSLRGLASASVLLIWITMGFGALVATSGALHVYNSFPTMDGAWTPPGAFAQDPLWSNFVTNKGTVQFCHRLLATVTALTVLTTAVMGLRRRLPPALRDIFLLLALLVALQYVLGMATLVLGNNELGFVHELNAVLLFATAIAARHGLRGAVAAPVGALAAAE